MAIEQDYGQRSIHRLARTDAPDENDWARLRVARVGRLERVPDAAGEVAFEAAHRFEVGLALGRDLAWPRDINAGLAFGGACG